MQHIAPPISPNFTAAPTGLPLRGALRANAALHQEFAKLTRPENFPTEAAPTPIPVPQAKTEPAAKEKSAPADAQEPVQESVYTPSRLNGNSENESIAPINGGDFELSGLIDILNPLQHIPVLGSVYRSLSGDTISGTSRAIGGAIFGGPIGLVLGIGNAIFAQNHGGQDAAEYTLNQFLRDDPETALAQNQQNDTADDTAADTAAATDADVQNLAELPENLPATVIQNPPAAPLQAPARPAYDLGTITPAPPQAMPELMRRALDKYEALIQERRAKEGQ